MTDSAPVGRFITIEGGDGAGKSTQLALLEQWLQRGGRQVVGTREPGGTELGERIRGIVLHDRGHVAPRAETLLYAADRAQHIDTVVRPALARGDIVLQDRYIDSSVAYQGVARGLGAERVRAISDWATDNLRPDRTILLDIDPAIGGARVAAARGDVFDRIESQAQNFHQKVREAFLTMAREDPKRFLVLDAALPQDVLATQIRRGLEPLVGVPA